MHAQVLSVPGPAAAGPLRPEDRPDPIPGPDELLLDVAACAVCRTDLQICEGDLAARHLPIIPGHQIVGRVTAVGSSVSDWTVGNRAGVAWLGGACGECRYCRSGRENLCAEARFTGWDRDGGYATRSLVRADFALQIPASFGDAAATPLLCGGIIGYRSYRLSGVAPGQRLGLFGFGASALLTLQVAVYQGCEVFVVTRSGRAQRFAREQGAVWAGGYEDEIPAGLDGAITFAPAGTVAVAALQAVAPGGTVAVNAVHTDAVPSFPFSYLWEERVLRSVANFTRSDATQFLEIAAAIPIRTTVQEYPLARANEALADLAAGRVVGAAVLVTDSP
jgi:propanol-preferring alcohol dehydrogenase